MNDRPAPKARTELGLQSRSALLFRYMIPSSGKISIPQAPLRSGPWLMVLALMVLALLASASKTGAQEFVETVSARSEEGIIEGSLDWANGILTVFGEGAAPAAITNAAQRRLAGFTAAREKAYRNLAEIAGEVPVDSRTKVSTVALADADLSMKLEALIKASRVDLGSRQERNGRYRLALKLHLRGRFSDTVLPDSGLALPHPGELPAADSLFLFAPPEDCTGLVVDARGTGLKPCLAPRIIDTSGRVIYSAGHAGRFCAVNDGVAGYESDLQRAATSPRVGGARGRPFFLEAEGVSGPFSGDVLISRDNGTRVLMADVEAGFLSQCGVVFLLGPKPEPLPFVPGPDTTHVDTAITATDSAGLDSVFTDSGLTNSAAADPYDLQLYRLLRTGPPLPPLADTLGYHDFDELFREAGRSDDE